MSRHHRTTYARHPDLRARRMAGVVLRRTPPMLLVGGALVALGGIAMVAMLLAMFFVVLVPGLLIGGLAVLVVSYRRSARRQPVAPTPKPIRPPSPETVWRHARERFARVRAEYAAFECDVMAVLRLPALADVSVESTARFVDAFAHAQAFDSDLLPPAHHLAEFVAAVDRAERAWRAACEAAERIRLAGLSDAERASVDRAIKLLTTARSSDNDAERLVAYGLARTELAKLEKAGVVHLPRLAQAVLDAAARGRLPAA